MTNSQCSMPDSQGGGPSPGPSPSDLDNEHSAFDIGRSSEFPPGRLPAGARPQWLELELPDGYRTPVCCFAPEKSGQLPFSAAENGNCPDFPLPVLYLHGIQSHPGWFVGLAAALSARGHPVYLVTRRGSGRNRLARGHAASAR